MNVRRMMKDDAVYWPPAGTDDFGNDKFGDPVPVKCHWEDTNEQFLDRKGDTQVSRSKIMLAEPVEEQGMLWQGLLDSLTNTQKQKPLSLDTSYRIRGVMAAKTVGGRDLVVIAML